MLTNPEIRKARERIKEILAALRSIQVICSGTLLERMKTCGKTGCRCANDPAARHGPYFEWTHMLDGKFAHRLLPRPQAHAMREAIANYHTVQALLKDWETESERLIDAQFPRKR
jgi:hypothetical protein